MRRVIMGAVGLSLVFAIQAPAHAIVDGQPDGGRHPYVGMVFQNLPGDGAACSGTLVGSRVLLTAGHCTETFGDDPVDVSLAPDARDFVAQATGTAHTYPGFCGGCGGAWGPNLGDLGVILLDSPISLSTYGQLPVPGVDDVLAVGTAVTKVGYGIRSGQAGCVFSSCLPGDFGVRTLAPADLLSAGSRSANFVKTSQNPSDGSGGACFGDSGGPVLLGDGPTVLGVHSFVTDWSCSGVAFATRIDQPAVLAWIRSWM